MKTRSIALLLAVAGAAALARGQIITTPGITANLSLSWIEDPGFSHNDNGELEPGEHALFLLSLSFTGQSTAVSFSPPIGTFSSGTIRGFSSAYIDIVGTFGDTAGLYNNGITLPPSTSVGPNSNTAGTTGYGVRGGWRLGGNVANGTPITSNNGFVNIGPGQFPLDPPSVVTTNPITNLDRLGWAPNSYASVLRRFAVRPAAGTETHPLGLYLDLDGGTTGAEAYLPLSSITFGSVTLPATPAPSGLMLAGAAGLMWGRRKRPGS